MPDPQQADQARQINPGRVIAKLTQQVGDQAQQIALLSAAVDELTEENDGLRAELVAATGPEATAE